MQNYLFSFFSDSQLIRKVLIAQRPVMYSVLCVHLISSYISRGEDGRWIWKTEHGDELYLDIDDEVFFLVKSIYCFPMSLTT
jgi:hypothetical protein